MPAQAGIHDFLPACSKQSRGCRACARHDEGATPIGQTFRHLVSVSKISAAFCRCCACGHVVNPLRCPHVHRWDRRLLPRHASLPRADASAAATTHARIYGIAAASYNRPQGSLRIPDGTGLIPAARMIDSPVVPVSSCRPPGPAAGRPEDRLRPASTTCLRAASKVVDTGRSLSSGRPAAGPGGRHDEGAAPMGQSFRRLV